MIAAVNGFLFVVHSSNHIPVVNNNDSEVLNHHYLCANIGTTYAHKFVGGNLKIREVSYGNLTYHHCCAFTSRWWWLLLVEAASLETIKVATAKAPAVKSKFRRMNIMKSSNRDKVEGTLHEAKGKIREVAGKITDNHKLELSGKAEKIAGKVQKKVGQVKKAVGK
jgi:uncharacterized protein YjbJ (UPF0337 family)